MKTQEEIEQLKLEIYRDIKGGIGGDYGFFSAGFNIGYTQCQEDMADKKYTEEDMLKCWNTLMVATALNKPIFFKDYINSLNKQD